MFENKEKDDRNLEQQGDVLKEEELDRVAGGVLTKSVLPSPTVGSNTNDD